MEMSKYDFNEKLNITNVIKLNGEQNVEHEGIIYSIVVDNPNDKIILTPVNQ